MKLAERKDLHALVRADLVLDYEPALTAYRGASRVNDDAALEVILDRGGSAPFEGALLEWLHGVLGKVGETAGLAALRPYFEGDAYTDFVRRSPRVQLERMEKLLSHAPKHPVLSLAPAGQLDRLVVATAGFEKAVSDAEGSADDRAEAVEAFAAATTEFDAAYGLLVRVVRRKSPAAMADLPRFLRTKGAPTDPAEADSAEDDPVDADPVDADPVEVDAAPADPAEGAPVADTPAVAASPTEPEHPTG